MSFMRLPRRAALALALLLTALGALPASARAQLGGTTDIITGKVTGPTGQPLAGARVEVTSVETGTTRGKTTNDKGEYTLLFPDGGGQYTVTVRYVGMTPRQVQLVRRADEDRLIANVSLSAAATQLATVQVQGRVQAPREDNRPTPGSTARQMTGEQLQRLPIDPSDPNAIALLSPGVVGLAGSDTSAAGFSVAGQRPDQNNITLDGLSIADFTVPQEAVRNTRVVTSTYDIARGQFTGGVVQTTTRGGTNQVSGSVSYNLREPHLQFVDDDSSAAGATFAQTYTQHQLSGGIGGPLKKDKLHYFVSGQLRRRLDPMQTLLGAGPTTLERLGTSPDSARRFLDLLGGYGLPLTVSTVPDDRLSDNGSGLVRLDWSLNDDHTLMVRGNVQGSSQNGFRTSALAVPSYGGEQTSWGGGGMLSLSSVMGTFLNEARASYSRNDRAGDPYLALPAGNTRIASTLSEGTTTSSTLQFGGNPGLPTEGNDTQLEVTDELSWLGWAGHRVKLGTLFNYRGFTTAAGSNRYGTFTFNSLEDFADNAPASFTRTLTPRVREGDAVNAAIYAGDTWRKSQAFQLTYGARLEYSDFLRRPDYNPAVQQLFGRRTDKFPSELHASPRVGFTWMILDESREPGDSARRGRGQGQGGGPGGGGFGGGFGGGRGGGGGGGMGGMGQGGPANATIVRGGFGEFRGQAPTNLFASAIDATGLPGGELQLVCIGAAVPTPNWTAYGLDPSSIPGECAGGGAGQQPNANQRPNVTVFEPGFGAPRAWRASLGVSRQLLARFNMSVDASYALGTNLYGARDLNLVGAPQFTLGAEGNRPVYVPATSIAPGTGATSLLNSRLHPEFAQVIEARSNLESRTTQVTVGVGGIARRALLWNMSYTFMRSTDQTSFAPSGSAGRGGGGGGFGAFGFGTGSATTAGDPNAIEWGTSDLERRHSVTGTLSWFAKPWLDLTSVVRLMSGQPFTPRVAGDINGDGSRNDRAFVYDPAAAPDTAIANGMARLLANTTGAARDCLESQRGAVAGRNSCSGVWTPTVDFQANIRPYLGPTLARRMTFMVSFVNPLAGLDQLFHGKDDLRGWGQPSRPDATLLYVRGFDASAKRFLYQVNERFGDTRAATTAIRNPFQIGVQARLQLGPDRQREMLMGMLGRDAQGRRMAGGGPGGAGGPGGGGPLDIRAMMERVAPNPARRVLEYRDTIQLTDAQVARLTAIGDSLGLRYDTLEAEVRETVAKAAGGAGDMQALFGSIQPRLMQARTIYAAALQSVRGVLTPEQWEKLPEDVRNPQLRGGPGMRGQGQQGQRRPGGRPPE